MKRISGVYALALLLLSLSSCEYAKYPVDDPAVEKTDARLMGKWKAKSSSDEFNSTFTVSRLDDTHYKIATIRKTGKGITIEQVGAFLSNVNNNMILNIHVDDKSDTANRGYMFLKILAIKPNDIITAMVTDSTMKYLKSPAEVRERIAKNMYNRRFFGDTTVFYRVK